MFTTPWAMLSYFESHSEYWDNLGSLKIDAGKYPLSKIETDRVAWRAYVQSLFQEAQDRQESIRASCEAQPTLTKSAINRSRSLEDLTDLLSQQQQEKSDLLSQATALHSVKMWTSPKKSTTRTGSLRSSQARLANVPTLHPRQLFLDESADNSSNAAIAATSASLSSETIRLSKLQLKG